MRKLIYYVACSLDNFIAGKDDSVDLLMMDGEHIKDLIQFFPETFPDHFRKLMGIRANNQCFDTVLMGRRTYQIGQKIGITNPYPQMKQYLISRSLPESPDFNLELISSNPVALVQELKQEEGKDIWLCGGGNLATTLFSEIDEMILKINPILLGTGIPLFAGTIEPSRLELTKSKIYNNGFMLLYYQVKHY